MTPPSSDIAVLRAAVFAGLLLAAAAVRAQVPAELPEFEAPEADPWPELGWLGFVDETCPDDVDCDCNPIDARDGLCVEEVRFDPIVSAKAADNVASEAAWLRVVNTSDLYQWLMEDIAWQLTESDTPAAETLVGLGVTRPDTLATTWDATAFDDEEGKRVTFAAMPERSTALSREDWLDDPGADTPGLLFQDVRYLSAPGTEAPPKMLLLSGRFASRLGYEGRRLTCGDRDCNLLDLGADTSGPFYEQLYPFRRERVGDVNRIRPLGDFLAADADSMDTRLAVREPGKPMGEDSMGALESIAAEEFSVFTRLVGSRVAEFGMADHTLNQMRVFTALTAMAYPPGELESATGISRDLVAAALGQTDNQAEALARVKNDPLTVRNSFDIRFDQLPEAVINSWVDDLMSLSAAEPAYPPETMWIELTADVERDVADLYRPGVFSLPPIPRSLDEETLMAWLRPALREAVNTQALAQGVRTRALVHLVDSLPSADEDSQLNLPSRDRVETWLLLDHLHQSVADTFDPNPGMNSTPEMVAAGGQGQWVGTLGRHGISSTAIGQGLGAVDPLSICTTKDGRAALSENAFGAIDVDVVLAATDGYVDAREVLWERRDSLPFLAVDQPASARPELNRLIGLPNGRALYRVRWKVWSGWHLLWDRDVSADGSTRAVLRVAAMCDDMVFSTPDEVATLTRAALLHDSFTPTEPPVRKDVDKAERDQLQRGSGDPNALVSGVGGVAMTAAGVTGRADTAASEAERGNLPDVPMGAQVSTRKAVYREVAVTEALTWIRSFVTPAVDRVGRGGPAIIFVFDHSDTAERGDVYEVLPRAPYARLKRGKARVGQVHSAGWAMYFGGDGADPVPLAPDYRPRVAEELEVALPRWERPRTLDWTLGLGISHFPFRRIWADCNYSTAGTWEGSVSDCARLQSLSGVTNTAPKVIGTHTIVSMQQTEGFAADFQAHASWWVHDRVRMAGELGIESHIEILHPGQSWYWGAPATADPFNALTTSYDWAFRIHTGPIVGARFAPRPPALWKTVSSRRTRPPVLWGVNQPDGDVMPYRFQWGVRGGFLMGPGYNGMEYTALTEVWAARSLALARTPNGLVSPYRPLVMVGPFARIQYSDSRATVADRYLGIAGSWTAFVGFRTYLRLGSQAPDPPEVEVPE